MELILLENIMNLGNIGDKVNVKPGYGRNYLLKTGKALRLNKENLDYVSKKKDELNKKNVELMIYDELLTVVVRGYKILIFCAPGKQNIDVVGFWL